MNQTMRLILKSLVPLSSLAFIVLVSSCTSDNESDFYNNICDTTNVSYSETVLPILNNQCISCHQSSNSNGVSLATYDDVKAAAEDGSLSGSINHRPGYSPMPQNQPKLSDCSIKKIDKWINEGSPNN